MSERVKEEREMINSFFPSDQAKLMNLNGLLKRAHEVCQFLMTKFSAEDLDPETRYCIIYIENMYMMLASALNKRIDPRAVVTVDMHKHFPSLEENDYDGKSRLLLEKMLEFFKQVDLTEKAK